MGTTIRNSNFAGGNSDGTPPINLETNEVFMDGWHCFGPVYYGHLSWRKRMGLWLLGVQVRVRENSNVFTGVPPAPRASSSKELYVIEGGRS